MFYRGNAYILGQCGVLWHLTHNHVPCPDRLSADSNCLCNCSLVAVLAPKKLSFTLNTTHFTENMCTLHLSAANLVVYSVWHVLDLQSRNKLSVVLGPRKLDISKLPNLIFLVHCVHCACVAICKLSCSYNADLVMIAAWHWLGLTITTPCLKKSSTSYFAEYFRAGLTDCKNFNGYRVRDN